MKSMRTVRRALRKPRNDYPTRSFEWLKSASEAYRMRRPFTDDERAALRALDEGARKATRI